MPSFALIVVLATQVGGAIPCLSHPVVLPKSLSVRAPGFVQEAPSVVAPQGGPITLDGILKTEEWASAARHPFPGGEVLFQSQGELVAVGVRGSQAGFPHIALSAGDSVWVLHASAALGMVVYARSGQVWNLISPPTWEVRNPSLTSAAEEERERYLRANGWVGTTGRMGNPGETEFLIRMDAFGEDGLRLAVTHLAPDFPGETTRWPGISLDDVGALQLLTGPMPGRLEFTPNQWALLLVSLGVSVPPGNEGRQPS